MKIIETKGKFRKSKAYGLIGCLALFSIIATNPILNVKAEEFNRTDSGQVDNSNTGVNKLIPSEEIKSVPNGEKNFNATVAFTTEAGLGSGTLVSPDTVVTVAHNFVHLNEKTNPISVENNVNKDGDVHIATLPNGEHSKFSNADVHYWNREGFVQGYKNDLAVVKLKNSLNSTPPAEITDNAKKLENGDKIHVFGYPKGKLEPIVNGTVENTENYGANIYGVAYQGSKPGASGGGLYDADGKLIGVNQNGVEGLRSGGITFSKEQLDWINSIVRGENAKPVYLEDKPKTDDKEEVHPKHGKLLYTDENVTGMIGKLYEDGTYIMKSNGKGNMILDNPNQGINSMFYGLTDKDGQPLSAEEVDAIKNKVKRIEVDGKIVADKLSTDVSNNTTELDLTGVTLSDKAEQAPFLAYYADNLTKLTLDSKLSLSNVKNVDRIIDNAPNLKLTNEQVTQLLKDTKFENSDGIFNNVGIERLDLTSFDNSKLNNSNVLFKNLKGLKEIAFGDKFNYEKYVPTGKSNSYFDTDLSTVEKVSVSRTNTDNSVFIKDWLKAVKENPDNTMKYIVWTNSQDTNVKRLSSIEDVLNGNSTIPDTGVYTLAKDNAKTHFYVDYYIQDENNKEQAIFYKRLEVKKGEWKTGERVEDYVASEKAENEIVYNNKTYKLRGNSELLISNIHNFNQDVENTASWNEDTASTSLYYNGEDFAFDGKVFKQRLYYSPKRKSVTEVFIDDKEDKLHQTDFGYNEEDYYLKDKYFSGYKNWEETPEKIKRPEYIEKNNKIYKFIKEDIIEDEESPIYKYRYTISHENTTKEEVTKVTPKDVYVADESRERETENIKTNGTEGTIRTLTTYKVDNDGNLTEEVTTSEKTEVINNIIKVGTKPKVEYLGRGKDIVRKTTTYTVNSETGVVSDHIKEEVNPEVDMHFYFVYSVRDRNDVIGEDEYRYYKGIILKEEEYIPKSGKWLANYTLHGNDNKGIKGVVEWPLDKKFEHNGEIYKVVGSSTEHIISGPDSNDNERSNYERDSKVWHEGHNSRLFYGGSAPSDRPQSEKDYVSLNELGLAKDGKVVKAFLYVEQVRGSYTQTFIDEDKAKEHENDEDYNPEKYSIKETYFSGYHKLTDDFILPKAPKYIQKDNKIYKLSSHTDEPKTEKYIDAYLYTEYRYKVIYDNTTKESIKEIQPKTIYESDESRDRNTEDVKIEGSKGLIKTITTYKVDDEGNLTENTLENNEKEVVNTIVKVGTKPKVEILKENNRVVKRTTTYKVNPETGEVITTSTDKLMSNSDKEPPIEEKSILKNIPDDIEKTTISHKVKYIPNYDKEFGYNKVLVEGKDGVTTKTTSYNVDENGNVTSNIKENVIASVDEEIEIGLKSKVEIVTENGQKIERTTKYELDENTGNISKKIENKILNDSKGKIISTNTPIDENGNLILPPVLDKHEFNGTVNSTEPPIEEKPEYTGPVSTNTPIDDKGELITPPVVEKQEFNGNVNSAEPPIVDKPEYKEEKGTPEVLDKPEYKLPDKTKEEPVKGTIKEETKVEDKKEKELPNTNSTSILTTLVSSVIGALGLGYKSKRKK